MINDPYGFNKDPYGLTRVYGRPAKERKNFKVSDKKLEWNLSAGRDKSNFKSTSKCRVCKTHLTWGNRTYEFDHKNNNNSDNRQENCYLVCRNCHGKNTVIGKRKITNLLGQTIGYKTIKKKVGYKKPTRRKIAKSKKPRKRQQGIWEISRDFKF